MDYETLLDFLKDRRTIRRFRPDPLPDDVVEKVLEAGRWAPSGFNMQPWDFVVIRKKELRDAVCGYVHDFHRYIMKTENTRPEWQRVPHHPNEDPDLDYKIAPVFILLLHDTRAIAGLPTAMQYDRERTQTIQASTMANAYLYMALAAESLGLAAEWISSVATAYPQAMTKQLIGIPDHYEVYDMMALGYPAYRLDSRKLLRDRETMVHYDDCGRDDFRTDEEVDDFIRRARIWTTANHRRGADKKMG